MGELYGATTGEALSFINDPNLRPEKSWTGELSAEKDVGNGLARATLFAETTRDALYSQPIPGTTAPVVSRVQNVDKIRTLGLELAYSGQSVWIRGLDLGGSLTYADSKIITNDANPASVGQWQPRVPRWRATGYATWQPDDRWAFTVAARYSGRQYSTLDNSDVNGFAYMGASKYFTVDLRARYKLTRQWTAAQHRQRQQLPVLELPPLPAAHLHGLAALGSLTHFLRGKPMKLLQSLAAAAVFCTSAVCLAHVTLPAGGATAGSSYDAAFSVGHAWGAQATQALAVQLPAGFRLVEALRDPAGRSRRRPPARAAVKAGEVRWTAATPEGPRCAARTGANSSCAVYCPARRALYFSRAPGVRRRPGRLGTAAQAGRCRQARHARGAARRAAARRGARGREECLGARHRAGPGRHGRPSWHCRQVLKR